jgi:hypothetical protein
VNALYPTIERWLIPERALLATLAGVGPPGRLGNESGAFWLGDRGATAVVRAVILPSGRGVIESPDRWEVSPEVFGAISRFAQPRKLTLLGIAHTHGRGVGTGLSWADRYRSVQVPGILAVVIGEGGADHDHGRWGWYVYEDSDYRELPLPERAKRIEVNPMGDVGVWRADLAGVEGTTG